MFQTEATSTSDPNQRPLWWNTTCDDSTHEHEGEGLDGRRQCTWAESVEAAKAAAPTFGFDGFDGWHLIIGWELVHGPDKRFPTVACSAYDERVFDPEEITTVLPDGVAPCEACMRLAI